MNGTHEFTIARVFDAPRTLLYEAWTVPEMMAKWWGPKGIGVVSAQMDLRPGGSYHYCMRTPDGKDMWGKFVYREVVPFERLVFVNGFSDAAGGVTRHPLNPDWPLQLLSTITFDQQAEATRLTIRWTPLDATPEEIKTFDAGRANMQQGWTGTLDQLDAYVATAT